MKNILKKLGVVGLIIAVLAPFMELPKVNATSTCPKHLQNYMFLDVGFFSLNDKNKTFLEEYEESSTGGYQTYTKFPYAFSQTPNSTIKVNWIETNNFNTNETYTKLANYWELASKKDDSTGIYFTTDKYYKAEHQNAGSVFVKNNTIGTYEDDTIIFHGVWSNMDMNGQPTDEEYEDITYTGATNYSIQKIFFEKDSSYIDNLNTNIYPAVYNNGRFGLSTEKFGPEYFQKIVNSEITNPEGNSITVPMTITRGIKKASGHDDIIDFLNEFVYGYESEEEGKYCIFTELGSNAIEEDTDGTIKNIKVDDSYTALKKKLKNDSTTTATSTIYCHEDFTEDDIDFDTTKAYYWPVVLTLEYEVCTNETSTWAVEYHGNVTDNSVTKIPGKQSANVGTNITLDTGKPERNGYTFKKWCETENGSGQCYNPGETITSPNASTTVKLFAQWGPTGPADNEKTGVVSYIIGFISVGLVAGGVYLISKKKNLFKQI